MKLGVTWEQRRREVLKDFGVPGSVKYTKQKRKQKDVEMLYIFLEENGEGGGWSRGGRHKTERNVTA